MDDNKFGAYRTAGGAVRIIGYNVTASGSYAASYGTGSLHDYGPTATYGLRAPMLVNDGGVTLSSIISPQININNVLAPVNNVVAPTEPVVAPTEPAGQLTTSPSMDNVASVSVGGALLGSIGLIMMAGSGFGRRRPVQLAE
jgi:hypothetical protein